MQLGNYRCKLAQNLERRETIEPKSGRGTLFRIAAAVRSGSPHGADIVSRMV